LEGFDEIMANEIDNKSRFRPPPAAPPGYYYGEDGRLYSRSGKATIPGGPRDTGAKNLDTPQFGDSWGGSTSEDGMFDNPFNRSREYEHFDSDEKKPGQQSRYTEMDRISDRFKKHVPSFDKMPTDELYRYGRDLLVWGMDGVGEGDEASYDFKAFQEEMDALDEELDNRNKEWKKLMKSIGSLLKTGGKIKKDPLNELPKRRKMDEWPPPKGTDLGGTTQDTQPYGEGKYLQGQGPIGVQVNQQRSYPSHDDEYINPRHLVE
jgi:hypothetical protein